MTPKEIQEKITDLERKSKNKALPASAVKKLQDMIEGLKDKLSKGTTSNPLDNVSDYESEVLRFIEDISNISNSQAKIIAKKYKRYIKTEFEDGISAKLTAENVSALAKSEISKSKVTGNKKPAKSSAKSQLFTDDMGIMYVTDGSGTNYELSDMIQDDETREKAQQLFLGLSKEEQKKYMANLGQGDAAGDGVVKMFKRELNKKLKPTLSPNAGVKNQLGYDCEDLVKKEKERHANSKKAAAARAAAPKKTEATKIKETLEKITEKVEKKYEAGSLTKAQIVKMISEFRNKIKELENLLKTAA